MTKVLVRSTSDSVTVTATVDINAIRRRLVEYIDCKGFGIVAGQGVIAIDALLGLLREVVDSLVPVGPCPACGAVNQPNHNDGCVAERARAVLRSIEEASK